MKLILKSNHTDIFYIVTIFLAFFFVLLPDFTAREYPSLGYPCSKILTSIYVVQAMFMHYQCFDAYKSCYQTIKVTTQTFTILTGSLLCLTGACKKLSMVE